VVLRLLIAALILGTSTNASAAGKPRLALNDRAL